MKKLLILFSLGCYCLACGSLKQNEKVLTETGIQPTETLNKLTQRAIANLAKIELDSTNIPRSVKNGKMYGVKSRDWTSGFYAGTLWNLYRFSKDQRLRDVAMDWTSFQKKERFDDHTHDLGFKVYCSFGEGYRLTNNETYKQVIIEASNQLIKRFDKKIGAIRSWDHNQDKWDYPVIIDNMMNLEMLFVASRLSGDKRFYDIANQHALKTLENHFRSDHSSYHVIDYHPDGTIRKKNTHQGYSHESAWSRGQAWGLYGFTMSYRETKNPKYLEKAKQIANFFFTHPNMPEDMVPYWDFNAPNIPNEERDASAAAIAASALLELCLYDTGNREMYLSWVDKALISLSSEAYRATTPPFLLRHSVGSKPHNSEIDEPLIYADYYFVEALQRRKSLKEEGNLEVFISN